MDISNIFIDSVVLGITSLIAYVLKVYIKPSEAEAKLISKVLLGVGMLITGFARRWAVGHKEQLDRVRSDLKNLRGKLSRGQIEG